MIQLRVRTEYSFRQAFGPIERVAMRLAELGSTAAGCVDLNCSTWGHVKWAKELKKAGITPLFGAEFAVVPRLDGKPAALPSAWALAADTSALYALTTLAHQQAIDGRPTLSRDQFLDAAGIVRFAGAALAGDAEAVKDGGCWLDLNPASVLQQQAALSTARRVKNARLVITSDNYFPAPGERKLFEMAGNTAKPTPQHLLGDAEVRATFGRLLKPDELLAAMDKAPRKIAALLKDVQLAKAPIIRLAGDVEAQCREGQRKRLAAGQIVAWTDEYEQRLLREIKIIREKAFDSYFLVVAEMVSWAKERMLVGPARGSAAGSLLCYLMGITEVDPLPYGLIFERFVDLTRTDLPDIDLDFPDSQRDSVYDHLREVYGREQVARIGTVSEYKPKSALIEVSKRLGIPPWVTQPVKDAMFVRSSGDSRANNCLTDTLNETVPGKALLERYPAISLAGEIEGHASHTGVHAAGVIVCNEPISRFCTVNAEGVACLDKKDAEAVGLLKVDVLGLRTLSVIQDAGVATAEQLYRMTFDDPAVYKLLNDGRFMGVFQWEGQALQSLTAQINVRHFEDMAHITALARPGPLGGGAATRFIERHAGREKVQVAHPSMLQYLGETFGLVLYQEQVMRMVREIGQFTWEEASDIRRTMSSRLGNEFFARMAAKFIDNAQKTMKLKKSEATDIWDQINSMGMWAFNKSHSVAYAMVSYWTAWLKAHHPLQYAAAALRNAKDEDSAKSLLREMNREGIEYVAFDADLSQENWAAVDGKLIGGFLQLKGIGPATAKAMLASRASGGLTPKQLTKLAKCEPIFGELYPARAKWRLYYEEPEKTDLRKGTRVQNISEFLDGAGEVVFIGQLVAKDSRDYNEAVRLAKRNGRLMRGQTLFLDMRVVDDSTLSPLLCRVDRYEYDPVGKLILERGRENHSWFLIRGEKLLNFPMVQVHKIRCLDDPELLTP